MNISKIIIFLYLILLSSCSNENIRSHSERAIASSGSCTEIIQDFFHDNNSYNLKSTEKIHPSGKKYLELIANPDIIENDPGYAKFLNETLEILYFPSKSFGHVKLRIGNSVYDFKGVKFTGIDKYHPKMKKNTASAADGPIGFIFKVGADKIKQVQDEVEMMYLNSSVNNIPPYDLFSAMIKIDQHEVNGRTYLVHASTSPAANLANTREALGKIINENGKYYLESADGLRVDVEKRADGYYTQSYSCLTSATFAMKKFFNIKLNYDDFPPGIIETLPADLQKAVMSGGHQNGESPSVVMKYYDE
jgi:hypothetical protein